MTEPAADPKPPESVLKHDAHEHAEGFKVDPTEDDSVDSKLTEIEMAGEEVAIGWKPPAHPPLAPEVRFLHVSRTIHQLITDRNRSVGIFLLVASVLINASAGLLKTELPVDPITVSYTHLRAHET